LSAPSLLNATDADYVSAWVIPTVPERTHWIRELVAFRSDRYFVPAAPSSRDHSALRCVLVVPPRAEPRLVREALNLVKTSFPHQSFDVVELDWPSLYWPRLADANAIIFAGIAPDPDPKIGFDSLCFALHRRGICTIHLSVSELAE